MSLSKFINCQYFNVPIDAVRCKNLEFTFLLSECICSLFLALLIRKSWQKLKLCVYRKQNYVNGISILILAMVMSGLLLSIIHNICNIGFFDTSESGNSPFLQKLLLMFRISIFSICVLL